jgi:predicted nucleotidyltransferase
MAPRWSITSEKIAEAVRRLVEAARPRRIIVFGSAARDPAAAHDLDLLVVTREDLPSPRRESVRLRAALRGLSMPIDILVVSERRLAELAERPGLIYREVIRTGRTEYEAG